LYGFSKDDSESTKLDTIKELFVSLTAISELGDMPKRITNNKWNQYLSEWESELETCKKIFDKSAT